LYVHNPLKTISSVSEPPATHHLFLHIISYNSTMAEPAPFSQPRSEARLLNKSQLLRQFAVLGDLLSAGALLIDVRRTDYEGGTIRGSLNMPAQSFPLNMATLYRLCLGDGLSVISRVIFYCGEFKPTLYLRIANLFSLAIAF
jgi:hypothetical protein